ncbi:alpha/beta hydrolase [Bradyrhizobium centrolobii]|uniref:Alpha/beta hydrolase n=1 Tax=Bradyrhizobium centrolobii TaxID=1505087 RepID=A0A176YMV6_9BRAD|nr:alpha/beta hydrolase [Bradyrhizobium centrolobii]OAF06392.1 alpha/beta hydrolase [Bradyrhizobium centrolobii]OAF07620.1 alpha/beta hydrolase [Bradyrhizobium centrolobii]
MDQTTPIVLVPGLASSARIYAPVIPALWPFGPVTVANHIRDDSMTAIGERILSEAPPRFALAGHSMGGYIAFEIMRQAPERVVKLALISTQARPDTPEATARRRGLMERARRGELRAAREEMFPELVHPSRRDDAKLRQLVHAQGEDVGVDGYIRQQTAIIARVDSRPTLATIRCPTLVLTGDQDNTIPNALSKEMAEGIAGAKLVVLSNCGHLPQPEQPEATAQALVEWLRGPVVSGARTA